MPETNEIYEPQDKDIYILHNEDGVVPYNHVEVGEVDADIDDALDEGYMGMECTLERGYSFSPSTIAKNERQEQYFKHLLNYKPKQSRYFASLKSVHPFRRKKKRSEALVDQVGLFNFISIGWLSSFVWNAYRNGLSEEALPFSSPYDKSGYNTQRLQHYWISEVENRGIKNASLLRVVFKFIKTRYLLAVFINTLKCPLAILSPIFFMKNFIEWLSNDDSTLMYGISMAIGLVACQLLYVICNTSEWVVSYRTSVRLKAACYGLLYQKVLKMSNLGDKSAGNIMNLFASDNQRIHNFAIFIHMIFWGPLITLSTISYTVWLLGPWSLFGIFVFLFYYLFQAVLARISGYLRRKTALCTDRRVQLITEIISSIKLIKMYAWEEKFADNVKGVRLEEKKLLRWSAYNLSISLSSSVMFPIIAGITIFLAYTGAGNNLTAADGLPILALLIGPVRASFNIVRIYMPGVVEGIESFRRIQKILKMDERENYVQEATHNDFAVELKDVTLGYSSNLCSQELEITKANESSDAEKINNLLISEGGEHIKAIVDITLSIPKGFLVGVCGGVGAGKSSLLLGILSQMKLLEGTVCVSGSCAYVSQQAWILNTTFRENILMGNHFVPKRYYQVIYACNLTQEVASLPDGDNCEIGERGVNLSGGQKLRLSLARALYSDRDVYLLDDPLSAVDAPVGKHIFHWAIKKGLQSKTVIFISHHLQYFAQCDKVILLNDGRILEAGTHDELVSQEKEYSHIFKSHMKTLENLNNTDNRIDSFPSSLQSMESLYVKNKENKSPEENVNFVGALTKKEKIESGNISAATFRSYILYAGGYFVACLVLLSFVVNVGATTFSSWWLAFWLSHGSGSSQNNTNGTSDEGSASGDENILDNPDLGFYQLVYGLTIVLIAVSSAARGVAFTIATIQSSTRLHNEVFHRLLRCPMSYFDSTPSGLIINLLSKDTDEADVGVPMILEPFLQNSVLTLSCFVILSFVFPYLLLVLFFTGVIFFFIWAIFRLVVRDLKRLENVSRTPLFSHLSSTVNGLSSILAYDKEELFLRRFQFLFDESTQRFYLFNMVARWLAFRLDMVVLLIMTSTAVLSIVMKDSVPSSYIALALAYQVQLTGLFQYTMRLGTDLEAKFTSIERLFNCAKNLSSEAPAIIDCNRPDEDWPRYGRVSFKDVHLRYRPNTPLVLNGVSFEVDCQEKIGIVGRTGSGKSSLGAALFRLVELTSGSIRIDGVNIDSIGLKDLRSRLSVIPQDPTLFIGTIRYNLDPFDEHSDAEVWGAIEKTFMKSRILALDQGLSSPVIENGQNFSVGERQLLCLARALLRDSKILFLDEATSGIDTETDSSIQETIQKAFSHCSLLTVAHRLNTVINCSKILVMDDGEVVEFDTPHNLLNRDSLFSKLVQSAHLVHV